MGLEKSKINQKHLNQLQKIHFDMEVVFPVYKTTILKGNMPNHANLEQTKKKTKTPKKDDLGSRKNGFRSQGPKVPTLFRPSK